MTAARAEDRPKRLRLSLAQLFDRLDCDALAHLDSPAVRRALNVDEPPVTFEALTEALCLGDAPSEHPVYDVLDVWHSFHRDVSFMIGARIGVDVALGGRGLRLMDYHWVWDEVAEYYRDALARRVSALSVESSPAADQKTCDGWCVEPHANDGQGFHHCGASTEVVLTDSAGRDPVGPVDLRLSRWAAGPDEPGREDPVTVEVHWPENAGCAGLTSLEIDEAERLARALLLKVADARHGGAQ